MKQKKPICKWKKFLLLGLQQVFLVASVICITIVTLGSSVSIVTQNASWSNMITPWDMSGSYENSEIFSSILRENASDILRMVVIRKQLESDGVYDGKKVIDVTEFANRYGNHGSGSEISAEYYLEDLLKWSKYGFQYYTKGASDGYPWGTKFTEKSAVSEKISGAENNSSTGTDTASETSFIIEGEEMAAYEAETDGYDSLYEDKEATYAMLENRYKTVDGKTPEELASNLEEYDELCNNLVSAANELLYNYEEYQEDLKWYTADKTNVRYCIEMPSKGDNEFYTNIELESESDSSITDTFKAFGKYILYFPANMQYESNTSVREGILLSNLAEYSYVYPDNVKIWFAVDTTYPVTDAFSSALHSYNEFMPYWGTYFGISATCMAGYLILLVYLCCKTGRKLNEDGTLTYEENLFDRIPTEVALILAGITVTVLSVMIMGAVSLIQNMDTLSEDTILCIVGGISFISGAAFLYFFYSLIRRFKAKTLWKNSLCCRLTGCIKRAVWFLYDNSNAIARVEIPFGIWFVVNLSLIFLGFNTGSLFFIVVAVVMDGFVLLILAKEQIDRNQILDGVGKIREGNLEYQIPTEKMHGANKQMAEAVNQVGDGIRQAVETSMKDERLKADLITNVSHDIKTPLTSIINYIDLIKRENIQDDKIKGYVGVLDAKSQRLKQLTEDLVEASKISSGNITLYFEHINLMELVNQGIGEFSEMFATHGLTVITSCGVEKPVINADSRRMWRVLENLLKNIYKYALEGTRVYIDLQEETVEDQDMIVLSLKNISAQALNINANELTERFIRGDVSRSTEGSGLGLSIAKNLTEAQHGTFKIYLDGDLFKVTMTFQKVVN
ncbi:MAG: HAMP domain-containing sensor histidine kinase [Lachnospiraceae bacterium]|nr:HAMP domain-containing sensor histidine kinase [Lachnospiraceae bacterium]